jgi:CO/xanthine dehydrogenase FAD-binding subunit
MDLHTITDVRRPKNLDALPPWNEEVAWLAGGTWLFSESQPRLRTLIDLETLNWPSLVAQGDGLEIAATCKVATLDRFVDSAPPEWKAAPLFRECCRAFLASFKIWNEATVGGNIVMSLPAGPMISLTASLEGILTLWPLGGPPRQVSVVEFVTGNHANVLAPGELVRSIWLPATALKKKFAFRRFTLTHLGRSEVLLIGTRCPDTGAVVLTVTASTLRPIQLLCAASFSREDLRRALDEAIPFSMYLDDAHGSPPHRQRLTYYFAEQIREELKLQ